jgi:hypothetical protein
VVEECRRLARSEATAPAVAFERVVAMRTRPHGRSLSTLAAASRADGVPGAPALRRLDERKLRRGSVRSLCLLMEDSAV